MELGCCIKSNLRAKTCYNPFKIDLDIVGIEAMSHRNAQIMEDALSLPAAERIGLVESLLASLDTVARQAIDVLWGRESEDRIDAFEKGEIPTISAKDFFDNAQER